ncbi:MAG: dehydrogenase [Lachnospiraceae bacterium]|nr:dehydrogenase [Lachnospiraceae bacterium]
MEKKTIVILGALEEFVPLVQRAAGQGIRAVVIDGNPGAPAKEEALRLGGSAYDADIRDAETVAAIICREHADAITTAYSDLLLECMVKIADLAHLPCHIKPAQLPWYRDKDVTNRTCEDLGIGTTKSVLLKKDFEDSALNGFAFPMIIKPLDMYGSRGLRIAGGIPEIRAAFASCLETSQRPEVLAEEYNDEYEFNMQCWVRKGTVRVLGIADREKTSHDPSEIPLSTRNIYPSRLIDKVYEPALDALSRYIARTGQTEGPLSMQFFWGPGKGFMVGEIAARYLGYEHELIEYTTGVSIEDILLAGAFDEDRLDALLDACDPFAANSAAVIYFHARDGIVSDISSALAIAARKDVQYGKIFYSKGDRIGSPQRMPYAARYYIIGGSREEIDARTEDILSQMAIRDAAGNDLLYPNRIGTYAL